MDALQRNGFANDETDMKTFKYIERDGIFVLLSQRVHVQ